MTEKDKVRQRDRGIEWETHTETDRDIKRERRFDKVSC